MAKKRARNKSGQFVADNPDTPENEAWVTVSGVEASGSTDNEAEAEPAKPKLMGPTGYVVIFFALLIMTLAGISA